MCAEQEINRRDHAEEPHRLEHQRQENAERGQDRHQRGKEQHHQHAAFHAAAGAEIGLQAGKGPARAGKAQQQRHDDADPAIKGGRFLEGLDQTLRLGQQHAVGQAGCNVLRLAQDCVALHAEGRQRGSRRARQDVLQHQVAGDRLPRRAKGEHGQADPQAGIPGVVDRQ